VGQVDPRCARVVTQEGQRKAHARVPALALAAALLVPPLAEAGHRHGPGCGHRPPAHGYYGHRPKPYYGHGRAYGYRAPRPYYRGYRHYAPPPPYYGSGYGYGYGNGYGGYGGYGGGSYGYGPGYYPPPAYCPPRPRGGVGIWFGF
jgi:hypothetical protein